MGKRQWAGALLGVGMLATTACLTYGYYLRSEARALMDDVRTLTLAPDRTAAFEVLRGKYGKRLMPVEGCAADICSYEVRISNHPLAAVFRVPYAELNARFDLRGKSVILVIVDYRSVKSSGNSPIVHVQTDFCTDSCGYFYVHPWTQPATAEQWNGIVQMGFATAPELRQAAFSLDPNCLTNVRGCTDIAQLLPSVWQPSENGVRCVVANREGEAR
jgi:hypothetical protein